MWMACSAGIALYISQFVILKDATYVPATLFFVVCSLSVLIVPVELVRAKRMIPMLGEGMWLLSSCAWLGAIVVHKIVGYSPLMARYVLLAVLLQCAAAVACLLYLILAKQRSWSDAIGAILVCVAFGVLLWIIVARAAIA